MSRIIGCLSRKLKGMRHLRTAGTPIGRQDDSSGCPKTAPRSARRFAVCTGVLPARDDLCGVRCERMRHADIRFLEASNMKRIGHQVALLGTALLVAAPLHAEGWTQELAPYLWGAGMDGTDGRPRRHRGGGPELRRHPRQSRDRFHGDVPRVQGPLLDHGRRRVHGARREGAGAERPREGRHRHGPGRPRGRRRLRSSSIDSSSSAACATTTWKPRCRPPARSTSCARPTAARAGSIRSSVPTTPFRSTTRGRPHCVATSADSASVPTSPGRASRPCAGRRHPASACSPRIAYMAMDYDNGSGDDYFKYDMAMSGPALGVVFTF